MIHALCFIYSLLSKNCKIKIIFTASKILDSYSDFLFLEKFLLSPLFELNLSYNTAESKERDTIENCEKIS